MPSTTQPLQQPPASRPEEEGISSAELYQIGERSLQTGALTGAGGLVFGASRGIMRSVPPFLYGLVFGIEWFLLGSSYMASRSLLTHAWGGEQDMSSLDKAKANTAAGGVAGMIRGMLRGPRSIAPSTLFFSAAAGSATYISHRWENRAPREKTSFLASKWNPMKALSDKEYENILEEKVLSLEAQIALIDESIAAVKASPKTPAESKEEPTVTKKH